MRARLSRSAAAPGLASLLLLAAAAMPACLVGYEEGATAEVWVGAALGEATDQEGAALDVARAWVHLGALSLSACDEASAPSLRRLMSPLGTAHAHHTRADGRSLEGGHVLDLAAGPTFLGTLRPPPSAFCAIELTIVEPEAESLGDAAALGEDTLRVEARRAGEDWSARSAGRATLRLPLDRWTPDVEEPARIDVALGVLEAFALVDTATPDAFDRGLDLLREMDASVTVTAAE